MLRTEIRDGRCEDIVYLKDADLKCFVENWDSDTWGVVGANYGVKVATVRGTVVGFAVFKRDEEDHRATHLMKLGVKPEFRNRGIGRELLKSVIQFARLINQQTLFTIIPEYMVNPEDPYDASVWLSKMGFRAVVPLVPEFCTHLGELQAGVRFELEL